MSIPKRLRRTIVVGNTTWEYCITGRFCVDIFLHNLATNERLSWYMDGEGRITPKDIRTIIEKRQLGTIKARVL